MKPRVRAEQARVDRSAEEDVPETTLHALMVCQPDAAEPRRDESLRGSARFVARATG